MVYFGPSRGCATCKRRRKKCDETRPSCMRCVTAKRTCGGYEDRNDLIIRPYENHKGTAAPFTSIARKCSLPVWERSSTAASIEEDVPKEVSDEESDRLALRAFFYDYCVVTTNPLLSRGFLGGLERFLHRIGMESNLAGACRLVAFANHGITLKRPTLSRRADTLYPELVATLAALIQKSAGSNVEEEAVLVAMLLGLYEIIVADESHPDFHRIHANGIAAMLRTSNDPVQLMTAIQKGRLPVAKEVFQKPAGGVFAAPSSKPTDLSLDSLLIRLDAIWRRGRTLLSPDSTTSDALSSVREDALVLDGVLQAWERSQDSDSRPSTIGHIEGRNFGSSYEVAHWPGRVDSYFDPSVASIWNVYRVARLLLIELVFKLSYEIDDDRDHDMEHDNVLHLLEDILASIPYQLVEDVHTFVRDVNNGDANVEPGRAVSGLLLMHALHLVSNLSIVNPWVCNYLKSCLAWIGQHMGIRKAALLAKLPSIDIEYLSGSSMIILLGFMV